MKILLDESLPARLAHELHGHKVVTVAEAGWSGKKNGELLKLAESKFDVFITIDQNLQYQVNLSSEFITGKNSDHRLVRQNKSSG